MTTRFRLMNIAVDDSRICGAGSLQIERVDAAGAAPLFAVRALAGFLPGDIDEALFKSEAEALAFALALRDEVEAEMEFEA